VVGVQTYITSRGNAVGTKAANVLKLSDDVTLRRIGSNETKQVVFGGLSYSAI
jgi:hypothetical protein